MRTAVRTPTFWLGLVLTALGGWWVAHDETMKYVFGLLFLTVGLVTLAARLLAWIPALKRSAAATGLGLAVLAVLAVGIVAPILRADHQTSTVWRTDIGGFNRLLVDGAILLAPRGLSGDQAPLVVALDARDGQVIRRIGTHAEGGGAPRFTAAGDFVQTGSFQATTTVDYYTYPDGKRWSREFASSRLTQVDVIAADHGFAAVRTCRAGKEAGDRDCVVDGIDPSGKTVWTRRLNPISNHDRSEDRLGPAVLGIRAGSVDEFRRLDLRDGSVVEEGRGGLGETSAAQLAERYEPDLLGLVLDHELGSAGVDEVTLTLDDETLTGHRDGEEIWSVRAKGAYRATVANGGIALLSDPDGWSPFLPWRTSEAKKVSMVRSRDGTVMATAVVPYPPLVYPLDEHSALATGRTDDRWRSDSADIAGANEQRLIGRR